MNSRHVVNLISILSFLVYLSISAVFSFIKRKKGNTVNTDSNMGSSHLRRLPFWFLWLVGIVIAIADIVIIYLLWHWLAPSDQLGRGYVFSGEWLFENPWTLIILSIPAGLAIYFFLRKTRRPAFITAFAVYLACLGLVILIDYLKLHRSFFDWLE